MSAEPPPPGPRRLPLRLSLAAVLALAACASAPPPRPEPSAGPQATAAEQKTALAAALAVQRQWLDSYFHGTPVQLTRCGDGVLSVEAPLEFCFEAGSPRVKPPLGAVLDRVAQSLRRRPQARLVRLAVPDDRPQGAALALPRAAEVRRHPRERGVPAAQLGPPTATVAAAVQLRIGGVGR